MPDKLNLRRVIKTLSHNPGAEVLRYGRLKADVIALSQGEGDAPTPDFIIKATEKALEAGKTFYGPVLGHEELRQEIASYYDRLYGVALPSHRVFVTGSGTTAMHLALTSLLDEGDEAVAITPIWKNLLGAVELAGARTLEVALDKIAGGWKLDLEKLFSACTARTKVILVTTPSNPTGWVMSRAEMRAVLDFARDRDIWVLSDEVYGRLTFDETHAPSFLDVAEPTDRLYIVNSFSKSWAMTGWRLGWLIGPAASETVIRDIALYDNMGPTSFTQFGAIEALRHGEDFIAGQVRQWKANRDAVYDALHATGKIEIEKPAASFYHFFKVKGQEDCVAYAKRLVDEAGLSLTPGIAFGAVGQGYLRLCFAVSPARLAEAVERLKKVL